MRTIAGIMCLAVLAACGSSSSSASRPSEEAAKKAEVFADAEFGTRLGITVSYPEARSLTDARLDLGHDVVDASLYPLDGTDPEPPPDPLPLAAHVKASVEGNLAPNCAVPTQTPVFLVTSKKPGSALQTERYPISNAEEYRAAARKVCRMGPRVMIAGSRERTDGTFTIELTVTNPGSKAVAESRAWVFGRTHYSAVRAAAPAGGSVTLKINGTGNGCIHDGPWKHGHVLLDGKVLPPPVQGYESPC